MQKPVLFVAIDTYKRIPRNWFGFKKKNAEPVGTPFSVSFVSVSKGVISHLSHVSVRNATLKDDPVWRDALPDMSVKCRTWPKAVVEALDSVFGHRFYLCITDREYFPKWDDPLSLLFHHPIMAARESMSLCVTGDLHLIGDEWFDMCMESGVSEVLINHEGRSLTNYEKGLILRSHERYVRYEEKKSCADRAIAMAQNYLLLQEGIKWTKNREAKNQSHI